MAALVIAPVALFIFQFESLAPPAGQVRIRPAADGRALGVADVAGEGIVALLPARCKRSDAPSQARATSVESACWFSTDDGRSVWFYSDKGAAKWTLTADSAAIASSVPPATIAETHVDGPGVSLILSDRTEVVLPDEDCPPTQKGGAGARMIGDAHTYWCYVRVSQEVIRELPLDAGDGGATRDIALSADQERALYAEARAKSEQAQAAAAQAAAELRADIAAARARPGASQVLWDEPRRTLHVLTLTPCAEQAEVLREVAQTPEQVESAVAYSRTDGLVMFEVKGGKTTGFGCYRTSGTGIEVVREADVLDAIAGPRIPVLQAEVSR
ncbi:hypothetical protein [Paraburkholderia mimosarum]|uniref:hypothetical protein n=1 Tax=Paraburkholderia mimosarum TaxID=312026 RepID=UPI0003FB9815|nr:hypothetical protein [Paraburkholderia mimosarum]